MQNADKNNKKMQRRRPYQRPRHRETPQSNVIFAPKKHLDINCNLAQGIGILKNPFEEKVLPYVTSVNISCGIHAGDPSTIARTVDIVKKHSVNIGALIGYPDIASNGEREMYLDVDELRAMILYQLGALNAMLHCRGLEIRHVRTHGFLYRQVYTDLIVAETVAKTIAEFSRWITLVGLAGPILFQAGTNVNIKIGQEVLIDRRYRKDGTILPYSEIIDTKDYLENTAGRAMEIVQTGKMTCEDKSKIRINVDTIHLSSDREESVELARTVRAMIPEPRALHMDKFGKYFNDVAALK